MLENLDIRYTIPSDETYLRKWLASENILHFFPMTTDKEVDDAVKCWIAFSKYSASLTATVNNIPCGIATLFLMPYRKVAHHSLFKVIVAPEFQRKGVGTALVRNIKHLAKTYFHLEFLHLEVFEGNPLIKLLEAQGFKVYARQEGFVKENGKKSTKVLMDCDLRSL